MSLTPSPWTRQPPLQFGLRLNDPLLRGVFFGMQGASPVDLVSGQLLTQNGGVTTRPSSAGLGRYSDGVDDYLSLSIPSRALSDWTLILLTQGDAPSTDTRVFSFASSTDNNPIVAIGTGATNANKLRIWCRSDAAVSPNGGGTVESSANVFHGVPTVVALRETSTLVSSFINGVADSTDGIVSPGPFTVNRVSIGCLLRATAGSFFKGSNFLALAFSRALSDSEIKALGTPAALWGLFQPIRRRIWPALVTAPSSIPTLSAVTATDITSTAARLRVTVTY